MADADEGADRQEADCRELAARLGLTVVDLYSDNDISAYSGRKRPGYRRMCADLNRPGAPTVVLCWHTDRLHRHPRELEDWITLAEARGIGYVELDRIVSDNADRLFSWR